MSEDLRMYWNGLELDQIIIIISYCNITFQLSANFTKLWTILAFRSIIAINRPQLQITPYGSKHLRRYVTLEILDNYTPVTLPFRRYNRIPIGTIVGHDSWVINIIAMYCLYMITRVNRYRLEVGSNQGCQVSQRSAPGPALLLPGWCQW